MLTLIEFAGAPGLETLSPGLAKRRRIDPKELGGTGFIAVGFLERLLVVQLLDIVKHRAQIGIGANYAVYLWMTMEVRAALGIHGYRPQSLRREPVSILYTDGYGSTTRRTIKPIHFS